MPDLYRLTKEQLLELDGFRRISAHERARLDRGVEGAAVLARPLRAQHPRRRLGDRAEPRAPLRRRSTGCSTRRQEEIQEVDGIGPDRAESIAEWFADEENRALVEELRELGLRLEVGEEERPVEGPLTGSQYVITGTLEGFTREEAAAALDGARRQGLGHRLEEDDRRRRRREPGLEGREGAEGRRADADEADLRKLLEDAGQPARPTIVPPPRRR